MFLCNLHGVSRRYSFLSGTFSPSVLEEGVVEKARKHLLNFFFSLEGAMNRSFSFVLFLIIAVERVPTGVVYIHLSLSSFSFPG
jgi:hypothetical protein